MGYAVVLSGEDGVFGPFETHLTEEDTDNQALKFAYDYVGEAPMGTWQKVYASLRRREFHRWITKNGLTLSILIV